MEWLLITRRSVPSIKFMQCQQSYTQYILVECVVPEIEAHQIGVMRSEDVCSIVTTAYVGLSGFVQASQKLFMACRTQFECELFQGSFPPLIGPLEVLMWMVIIQVQALFTGAPSNVIVYILKHDHRRFRIQKYT